MTKTQSHYNSKDVLSALKKLATPQRAKTNQWFFKTKPGEYGYGDTFWGLSVPQTRKVAKQFQHFALAEVAKLLCHHIHEVRSCVLEIMVMQMKQNPDAVYDLYLTNMKFVNNWDLVDASASAIVGEYLYTHPKERKLLDRLVISKNLWERRIAIVATYAFIRKDEYELTFKIAEKLLGDTEDLLHKATGWMLREVGKRGGEKLLEGFLQKHAAVMPRTMLRYAI